MTDIVLIRHGETVWNSEHRMQGQRNSALSELLLDRQSLMFELLEPAPVRTLLEDHRAGRDDNHKLLFSLAMFEQWLRGVDAKQPAYS